MEKIRFDPRRIVPPLVLGAISIGYIVIAKGFTNATSAEAPLLYGEAMAGLSLIVLLLALRPAPREAPHEPTGSVLKHHPFDAPRVALIHGLAAAAILLIYLTGFYVGIPLFLFAFCWRVAKLSLALSAVIALVFLGFTWLCFGYLLNLEVYQGYLYPILFLK